LENIEYGTVLKYLEREPVFLSTVIFYWSGNNRKNIC